MAETPPDNPPFAPPGTSSPDSTPTGSMLPESRQSTENSGEASATPQARSGDPDATSLRWLVSHSLLVGLSPLIPVPLVDDWARDHLRRRLTRDLGHQHGLKLAGKDLQHLACGPSKPSQGCLKGCLTLAFLKPVLFVVGKILRKIFRKILFLLTIKDCVDAFSQSLHEAWLVRHALCCGHLEVSAPEAGDPSRADGKIQDVRQALDGAIGAIDHRPVEQLARRAFRHSRALLTSAAAILGERLKRHESTLDAAEMDPADADRELVDSLADELTDELEGQRGYFLQLEKLFDERMSC